MVLSAILHVAPRRRCALRDCSGLRYYLGGQGVTLTTHVAGSSYDASELSRQQRTALSVVTRVIALGCAIASAGLAVYCVMLVYAATTFEHDSLPGPAVLFMVAVGVGLVAALCGGVAHLLWRASTRQATAARRKAD